MGNRFAHVHNMGRSLNLMSLTWGVLQNTVRIQEIGNFSQFVSLPDLLVSLSII